MARPGSELSAPGLAQPFRAEGPQIFNCAERPSMSANEHFIRFRSFLWVDTRIARFAGYGRSLGSATHERSG